MTRSAKKITTIYLVIFALVFNAVSASATYAVSQSKQNGVLLCTSQGYKWVSLESQPESDQGSQQHCKLCVFPSSDDNFICDSGSSVLFGSKLVQLPKAFYPLFKARFTHLVAQGRAPPLKIFSI